MTKYTLSTQNFEKKHLDKLGKDVINTSLKDERGVVTDKVSIWQDFPNFENLKGGDVVEGDIRTNDKGFHSLKGAYVAKNGFGGGAKAMEQKTQNIEKAMDRKEESIMIASTASMATSILTSLMTRAIGDSTDMSKENWKEDWLKIRYYLVKQWENTEQPKISGTEVDYPQNLEDSIPF